MAKMEMHGKTTSRNDIVVFYVAYYLVLTAMLAASFFPEYRIWGFNHWAYYPSFVAIGLFGLGVALPFVLKFLAGRSLDQSGVDSESDTAREKKYWAWVALLIVVYLAGFYFLRARTHFLGDGYQLVANLPEVNPWIKIRNLGEELIHKFVYGLLSGDESVRSLLSFQFVSYFSGFIFLVTGAFAAGRLFKRNAERILFFLGLASSGYVLLFFGYVENYSVFVTLVAIYALTGLLILNGQIGRWYILLPLLPAILSHALGVTLIPSTIFLLAAGTSFGTRLSRLSLRTKLLISGAAVVILAGVFGYFYNESFFFRLAMVPLVKNRLTIENYTLFSIKHIVDIINLLLLLLPSFLVFLVIAALSTNWKQIGRDTIFLLIMAISTLGAVILFDPKLGMPRDWDLFSFCGVPAALLAYYTLLKRSASVPFNRRVAVVAIFLGIAVLIPRAVGRATGDIEVSHVENYIRLDVVKNKNVVWLIQDYYTAKGDEERARVLMEQWRRDFPERSINEQGVEHREAGRYAEAIPFFRAAARENPMHAPTYSTLAECYRHVGMYDSAATMLEIADGINPNSATIILERGYLHRERRLFQDAEKDFQRVLTIDDKSLEAYLGLLELYWATQQIGKHDALLIRAATHPDAPAIIHKRLADVLMSRRMYREANIQYRTAISKGLDSTFIQDVLRQLEQFTN